MRGFSLVEILISIVIFSVVILALSGLAFQVARRSTRATDQALLMSVLQSEVDMAATVPYDSLSWIAGCDTTTTGQTRVFACTTVTVQSVRLSSIQIIVSTSVPGGRPDTVTLQRGKPRVPIPIT